MAKLGQIQRPGVRQEAYSYEPASEKLGDDPFITGPRTSVLTDKPSRGTIQALTDLSDLHGGIISREDVARFVLDQLRAKAWLHRSPSIHGESNFAYRFGRFSTRARGRAQSPLDLLPNGSRCPLGQKKRHAVGLP